MGFHRELLTFSCDFLIREGGPVDSTSSASPTTKPSFFYGWYIVIALWAMIFLTGSVAVSIFFRPMLEDFQWDRAVLSSVQSVAMIVFTIASPFLGRLIDRFGPRTMLIVCVGTQVLSRVLNGVASNIWHLYLARFLYGINVLPSGQVLISRWFVKKRGTALGIFATGMSMGTMVLTPVSQHLILTWGWRVTMLFWAGITFAVTLPLAAIIRNDPEEKGCLPDGDLPGAVLPIYTNPLHRGHSYETAPVTGNRIPFSEAMKTGSFWLLAASHFICGLGCGFMMTHIVAFAADVGFSDMIGASLVSVQGGINLFGLLFTGLLSDRIARKNVLSLTHLVRSASFGSILVFISFGGKPLWLLYVAIALFGFGWFTTAPLASGLVADLFGDLHMGTILGAVSSCHMFGMALGAYAGGVIFDTTRSYYLFFVIQGLLEFLAAVFAFLIKQRFTGVRSGSKSG
jgi:MFS family permease